MRRAVAGAVAGPTGKMEARLAGLDLRDFDVLTFDCYGTLVDWEAGILAGFRPAFERRGRTMDGEALLERYAGVEAELEAGPYLAYREVLGRAFRRLLQEDGIEPTEEEVAAFAGSVRDWPAFPDAASALELLGSRFRLGVITNCDADLFAASNRLLGNPFAWVVPASEVGAYKPDRRNFLVAFERIPVPRERILHVAQSLFHDHVPARELGLRTAWIDRRAGRSGSGATPPAAATPDLVLPDLASLAGLAIRSVSPRA